MPYSLIKSLIVLASLAQNPSVVSDPVSDFLALDPGMAGRRGDIQEVYVVRADISGDGQKELFLSHQNFLVDRAGYGWYVYAAARGGYQRIEYIRDKNDSGTRTHKGVIRLRTDAFHVGKIEGVEGTELFSYRPGGGQTGGLIGIWLKNGALEERKVRDMIVGAATRDLDEFNQLFGAQRGEIVKAKVEDLATEAERMALIGGPPPESTGRFVSKTAEEPDNGKEQLTLSSQESGLVADAPSIRAALDEGADESATATETAPTEEPEGSGWPGRMLVVSIGALAFLLALAGYRVFSKAVV